MVVVCKNQPLGLKIPYSFISSTLHWYCMLTGKKYTVLLLLLPGQHPSGCIPLPVYKYVHDLWLNLFYLLAVSWSFLLSPRIMRKVLFFCGASASRQVNCGWRTLKRSLVISGKAFYILQTPGATNFSVWNGKCFSVSTYFYLSVCLNINLYVQISPQEEADSYPSPCCLQHKRTTLTCMHRAGVLIPGAI